MERPFSANERRKSSGFFGESHCVLDSPQKGGCIVKKRVAIVVFHGIGEHEPFETLDIFVQPFSELRKKMLRESGFVGPDTDKHCLSKVGDQIESYVSLRPDVPDKPEIDVYEYYWSHMTQREITTAEVVDWVFDVARSAKKFYKNRKDPKLSEENPFLFTKDGEFRSLRYLVFILSFANVLRYWLVPLAKAQTLIPLSTVKSILSLILEGPLVDSLGDVTLYTSVDKKSKYYEIRERILDGATDKVRFLMEDSEKRYEEILLLGHSLGSAIAYDTLARLNKEMNVDPRLQALSGKVKGLVTFGSPLDKIAFFFDEQISKEKHKVRYAIASQLHGFRRVNVDTESLQSGVRQYFEHLRWLNFYTISDPVCGSLDVYKAENIPLDFSKDEQLRKELRGLRWISSSFSIKSHSLYWKSEEMYRRIIEEFELV
jgi:hypothetical protein